MCIAETGNCTGGRPGFHRFALLLISRTPTLDKLLSHPSHGLITLLLFGKKRLQRITAKSNSIFPQAIRLINRSALRLFENLLHSLLYFFFWGKHNTKLTLFLYTIVAYYTCCIKCLCHYFTYSVVWIWGGFDVMNVYLFLVYLILSINITRCEKML